MALFDPAEMNDFRSSVERAVVDYSLHDNSGWTSFASLGLLALNHHPDHDGLGGGLQEMLVVQVALGKALVQAPFLTTVGIAANLVSSLGSKEQCSHLLPQIAEGRAYYAANLSTDQEPLRLDQGLHGEADLAWAVPGANAIILAQRDGAPVIAIISLDSEGVSSAPYQFIDGMPGAKVRFSGASPIAILSEGDVAGMWRDVRARAAILAAAETLGAIDGVFEATLEHVRSRQQFGQPISRFQAVRHKVADMEVARRRSRALVKAAARSIDEGAADHFALASAAKIVAGRDGRTVGELAVQLHGGMGVTSEGLGGRYLLRLLRCGDTLGGAEHHLGELGATNEGGDLELAI